MPKASNSQDGRKNVAVVIDLEWAVPWHQDCYRGVMTYAEEQGWRTSLDLYAAGIDGDLSRTDYDGVVGRIPTDVAERMAGLGVPMSNLTPYVESNRKGQTTQLPGAYVDKAATVAMAVEHLAHSGYPRIAVVTQKGEHTAELFEHASAPAEAHGLQWMKPLVLPTDYQSNSEAYASLVRSLNQWLADLPKPTGLVVHFTTLARIVAHTCTAHGLNIPQDIGIVTPIGDRIMLLSAKPTISAVEVNYFRQGYEAAAILDKQMKGEELDDPKCWIKPVGLIQRDSTDVFFCDDKLVSEAMRYIAAHAGTEVSAMDLAQRLKVSRWTLHRRFIDAIGKTPQQQINQLRAEHIKRLLRESDDTVSEVAYQLGFTNPSHFSRFFKRESGHSPSGYRELFRTRTQ